MTYEAWRCTYQSSEQAARAAYDTVEKLAAQRDELLEALTQIMQWDSHPLGHAVEYGSNGVRDFYRDIAHSAITKIRAQATTQTAKG